MKWPEFHGLDLFFLFFIIIIIRLQVDLRLSVFGFIQKTIPVCLYI